MAKDLQQWSPFRELERFRRDFDDLFDRFFGGAVPTPLSSMAAPKIGRPNAGRPGLTMPAATGASC